MKIYYATGAILVAAFIIGLQIPSENKVAYQECFEDLEDKLKSPASYKLEDYTVSMRKPITPEELVALEQYKYRINKGLQIKAGRITQDDILYDYYIRNLEQAEYWFAEAQNGNLWNTIVYITYDADNSFGASLRDRARCEIIWTGETLKSAMGYSAFDKRSAEVMLVD